MKFTRILSNRHYSWISQNYTDIRDVVFLVKDLATGALHYAQYFIPSAKPVKAYYRGLDITSFLTHRSHLTAYSYYFINYAYTIGFTIKDVRAYFNGFVRVRSLEPNLNKLRTKGLTGYKQRVQHVEKIAHSSQTLADSMAQPMDVSTPGFSILEKMRANRVPNVLKPRLDVTPLHDGRIFSAAWKLSCLRVLPFKFADTQIELKQRLHQAGMKDNALLCLKEYLSELIGELTEETLAKMLGDTAKQYGWFESGVVQRVNTEQMVYNANIYTLRNRPGFTSLLEMMFPESFKVY